MTSRRFDLQDAGLLWHGGTETGKGIESQAEAEESACRWMVQKQGRAWERSHSPGPDEASHFMRVKMLMCEKQRTAWNSVWMSECEHVSTCILEW